MQSHEAISAIRSGSIDGLFFNNSISPSQIVPLNYINESYRVFLQEMNEGAATLTRNGLIVFANNCFSEMVQTPLESIVGASIHDFICAKDRDMFARMLSENRAENWRVELSFCSKDDVLVPVYLSFNRSSAENPEDYYYMVATDLTERKQGEKILSNEQLARSIMENANEAIVVCDESERIIRANQKAIDLCQCNPTGSYFDQSYAFLTSDGNPYALEQSVQTMFAQEVHLYRYDKRIDLLINTGILLDENNKKNGYVITLTDITQTKKLTEDFAKESTLLETTLVSVGDGVISCDIKGNVLLINRLAEELTGWKRQEAKNRNIDEVFCLKDVNTQERIENIVERIVDSKQSSEQSKQAILLSQTDYEYQIEYNASPILHGDDEILGVVIVFRDIFEKVRRLKEIEHLSFFDQLTGLYNRRFYEEELRRLDTERNLPIAMIMADVNGLKMANDAFGHNVGDELLRKSATIIKEECRADDIVARIGGDEFVVLLPKTDDAGANHLMNRINKRLSLEQAGNLMLSISFGYAVKQNIQEDMKNIFIHAENNMYRQKLSESASMRSKNIDLIITSLYEKSHREMLHSKRVSIICEKLAINLNFSKDEVNQIRTAGLMHDIGKIGVTDSILNKSERLSENEWVVMMRHPEIGYRILSSVNEFSEMADYILYHHERWDGKGYPKGINQELIPLQSRIIALADAYDAMTSDRMYRAAMSCKEAIEEIKRCAGTQFDPVISKVFIDKVLRQNSNM